MLPNLLQTRPLSIDKQLIASSLDKYYTQFKAYVPDQDRMLRFLQYTIWFAAKLPFLSSVLKRLLMTVYDKISFGRYLFRFHYLMDSIKAAKSGSWGGRSGISKCLGHAMAVCMVGYYPLEHASFLLWYQPQLFPSRFQPMADPMWSHASKFWFFYLLVELAYFSLVLHGPLKARKLNDGSKRVRSCHMQIRSQKT